MWEKIKAFFEKKVVIIVESVVIALAAAGLFIGGVNAQEAASKIAANVLSIITAIEALITLIQGLRKK